VIRRRLFAVVGLLLLASGAATAAPPPAVKVTIRDHTFLPKIVHVKRGQAIIWTNVDQDSHTITSGANNIDDGRWKTSALIPDGQSFTLRLERPGTYPYFCEPHQYQPSMHGTILVTH
jgi:plastocyanin